MNLKFETQLFIDGEWCPAESGAEFPVTNPATGEELARVPAAGPSETNAAIRAAARAFRTWSVTTAGERAAIMRAAARKMIERRAELARVLTLEQGKPLAEAEREIAYAASYLDWYAEEARRIAGETIPAPSRDKRVIVLRQPIGVCAAITPWNFPSAILVRKLAAALAAGCTMVAKPAPETPLSAFAVCAILAECGLPPGVCNVVTGEAEPIAAALLESPLVRKCSFTGSTEVGKLIYRGCADTIKRLTLELGGNAPMIIFEDADLEAAADAAVFGKYRNSGQTCVCVNRFLVHESVANRFTDLLTERSRRLRVGNGLEPDVQLGPLISTEAVEKVRTLVSDALASGARLACGAVPPPDNLFVQPIVLSGVTPAMRISREEVFGPVSPVTIFRDESEAVAMANDTEYGLAAYFWTKDLSRAFRVAEALEYGMVGVNDTQISAAEAPFGGIKQSGFGREGAWHGIEDYLSLKYVSLAV